MSDNVLCEKNNLTRDGNNVSADQYMKQPTFIDRLTVSQFFIH